MCQENVKRNFYTETPKLLMNEKEPELTRIDLLDAYPAAPDPCKNRSDINNTLVRLAQCNVGTIAEGNDIQEMLIEIPGKSEEYIPVQQTLGGGPEIGVGTPPILPPGIEDNHDDTDTEPIEVNKFPMAMAILAFVVCICAIMYAVKGK